MSKTLIIVGMGPGLSMGLAQKFGAEGFRIGMISRNAEKLKGFQEELKAQGISSDYTTADVANTQSLLSALDALSAKMGRVDVVNYNAVDARFVPLLEEKIEDLTKGFTLSVGNALAAVRHLLPQLKASKGAVLLTGGGSANYPNPNMASISLGKAGIRNLAYQLHQVCKKEEVYVGTLTINGWIQWESETHSPKILGEKFWELYQKRDKVEMEY
ncbi:SDR family NAD(P)-dependent oxidoreductase [Cytophagales bacterium LB-30]|uniref:SDR family NAD(P)-dependent oxidoreductase n=1 Tax=Shiella aurantiaca TaxID=3058365 RepID=A0ABT8F538_9BACT|nr:SDR family NAD(P)-dependent oxidoreductase [Shiella aurantiaca]MDN4165484.1 SDR family NAD(P)-dependent oxidoreductase [Shiella aurantiaca]